MDEDLNEVSKTLIGKGFTGFVADALKVVKIKFVDSIDDVDSSLGFEPEFVYQHFGESGNIVGYKDLNVSICYASASLLIYPLISFKGEIPKNSHIKTDDIVQKIRDQLPHTQPDAMVFDVVSFQTKLDEQKSFKPIGQLVSKFGCVGFYDGKSKEIQVFKVDSVDRDTNCYIQRAQSLALWYIDAAEYTGGEDTRFFHYFAFEASKSNDGSTQYKFVGYSTLYRFYYHPDKERLRISHILIIPPYQRSGCGVKLLTAIYSDLRTNDKIYDITAETPVEKFIFTRDVVNCVSCFNLPEFSKEELMRGFSKGMREAARSKFKIHGDQARRVYQILRLHHSVSDKVYSAAFKRDVKARIEKPFLKNSERNFGRLQSTFGQEELNVLTLNQDPEEHEKLVEEIYENTVHGFMNVLSCLKEHEQKFLH